MAGNTELSSVGIVGLSTIGMVPVHMCAASCFSFYAAEMDLPLSLDVDIPGQEMAIPWRFYYSD